jgi:hypothetical protein
MSAAAYAAIDFGTTQTTAAVWAARHEPMLIKLDGRRAPIPSAVFYDGNGLIVGPPALRALRSDPLMGERKPKQKLRQASEFVDFGGRQIVMMDVVSRVLARAYTSAVDELGREPTAVCLTRPAAWSRTGDQEDILRAAASLAKIHCRIQLVSESEAAARSLGIKLGVGESCVVYDLGGGTCDIAVMEMTAKGLALRAESEREIGGETFDARLFYDALRRLRETHSDAADILEQINEEPREYAGGSPESVAWLRCKAALEENLRRAKVRLSTHRETSVLVPAPVQTEWQLTREDFEQLVIGDIAETVEATRLCVEQSGLSPSALYLAGAASATPAVRDGLAAGLGLAPVRGRDPKGATVMGGLRVAAASLVASQQRRAAKAAKAKEAERTQRTQAQEAARHKAAEEQRAHQRAHAQAAATDTEVRRQLASLPRGKSQSREKLAQELRWGERCQFVASCVPPTSVFHNGIVLVTDQRLLWSRQTWSGSPEVTFLSRSDVKSVTAGSALVRVENSHGATFAFGELPGFGDAPKVKELLER